jgi:hypothetical protein
MMRMETAIDMQDRDDGHANGEVDTDCSHDDGNYAES